MKLVPRDFRNFYFDDIIDDFFTPPHNEMKCDIYEKEGNYTLEIDIPGFDKKDIKIEEKDGYLTVAAEKNEEINDESKNYIRKERNTRRYQRTFYLGNIKNDSIQAEFKDGILTIIAPKNDRIDTKNTIEIR